MALDFETTKTITTDPLFIVITLIVWLLPIIIWLIIGTLRKARSGSGRVLGNPMIASPNFWLAILNWFFFQGLLFAVLITWPVWIKLIPS